MSKIKISVGFSKFTDSDMLVKSKHISLSMTGNTNYPTPSPTLAVLNASVGNYETALGNAEHGSVADTLAKNAARASLESTLQALGMYVQLNCSNDAVKAQSSGFDIHAPHSTVGLPDIPMNVSGLRGGHSGEVVVTCDAQADADTFCCRYSLVTTTPVWVVMMAQKNRKFQISGLTHGKDILVSMCAINSAGNSDWSDAVSVLVD